MITCGLENRRQILAQSWGRVSKLEHDCVSDASTAWRRCFVITWEKLKEFFENARCDHDRMEKYWQDKVRDIFIKTWRATWNALWPICVGASICQLREYT